MDEADRTAAQFCLGLLLAALVAGCVGPTTPLGAVDGSASGEGPVVHASPTAQAESPEPGARILFSPTYQRVHEPYTWHVLVVDPAAGEPLDAARLRVFYNGLEVTESARFQFRVQQCRTAEDAQEALRLEMPYLRLGPMDDHEIVVEYAPAAGPTLSARYPFPVVAGLAGEEDVATTSPFRVPAEVLETVYEASRHYRLNPVLLVALIAQESGFNPHALSKANALGLTQVTHLAEADIAPHFQGWPRYRGIQKLSRRKLRKLIPAKIHGGNEWRLDPVKSIWGGAYYLAYLRERLSVDENRRRVEKVGEAWEQLLTEAALASYNSGLNRILYHAGRYGDRWLDQAATREAKRYVRKILSYYGAFLEPSEVEAVVQGERS
jgi:hypothetical protein